MRAAHLAAGSRARHLKRQASLEVLVCVVVNVERHDRCRHGNVESFACKSGLDAVRIRWECWPHELITGAVVQVVAPAC